MATPVTSGFIDSPARPCSNGTMARFMEVGRLPDGTRFRMEEGVFDERLTPPRTRVTGYAYGTKLYTVGESRCRVRWEGKPALATFKQADGTQHQFTTHKSDEGNLPVMVQVEPLTPTPTPNRSAHEAARKSRSTVDEAQVRALQGRYAFQRRMQEQAIASGDAAKIEMAEGRISKIVGEAAAAGVTLDEPTDSATQANGTATEAEETIAQSIARTASPTPVRKGKVVAGKKTEAQQASAAEMAQTKENQVQTATKAAKGKPSLKEQNAVRLAALKAKKLTEVDGKAPKAAKAEKKTKAEKKLASTHDCICGCGQETAGKFAPGHDARVKGMLYKVERGELEFDKLPKTLLPYVKMAGRASTAGKDTSDYRVVKSPVKFPGRDDIEIVGLIEA